MMRLYKISQTVNSNWNTYDSAVVAAPNEDVARWIHPRGEGSSEYEWGKSWCKPEDVIIEYIGATSIQESQVIVASYNAG